MAQRSARKGITISNSFLSKSKYENVDDNKINLTQSKKALSTNLTKKRETKSKPVTKINNMDKSNICTVRHNIKPAQLQAQESLHDKVWGIMAGAHSLPFLSEVNKLKAREPCKTITNIQGHPYTYTVG